MADYAVRALSHDGQIRGFAVLTKDLVTEIQKRHHLFPVATAALGRTATMGAIMGLTLKEENQWVTIQVHGDGPIGKIIVDATGRGTVRGFVENGSVILPANALGKTDVAGAVGKGNIYITKDLGMREPYRGSSPIVSGELAEDFTFYYTNSEQVPTSIGLGVLSDPEGVVTAGGYMMQVMPGATDKAISELEKNISEMQSVTDHFKQYLSPEQLLERILGPSVQFLSTQPIQFQCTCSREKIESMIKGLGKVEVEAMLIEDGEAEVICHYCNEKYHFIREDLENIVTEID